MPRGNQLTRQWRLLHLLDRPGGVAVEDAARELGCVVRTIWRDLRVLENAGFPIYDEPAADGRRSIWRLQEDFRRRLPLNLSLSELAALLMSQDLMMPAAAGLGPAVTAAFEKIGSLLSKSARALLERMRETVGVRALGAKLQAPAAEHLRAIQTALLERRRLRLRYYSLSRDELTDRRVDPYHLTLFNGGFYLVAHCHLRQALRIFAVERIRQLEILATRFEPPETFDVEKYLAGAWGILRGDIVTVRVVFARPVARYIKDRLWHPTQRLRDLDGGRVEVTLEVADTVEVRRWILGFGSEAEVLEPAALREALRVDAEALARRLLPQRIPPAGTRPRPATRPARLTRARALAPRAED
jgi:predicted DNA-binding transcriptional regulator YafY